ncbi:MAG: dynamin family protein [Desulfatibacillaceae bacterium]
MDIFEETKNELLDITDRMHNVLAMARFMPGVGTPPFETWLKARDAMREQVEEGVLRVAVVGSIKSGKSTFVNSYFGGDYLKRGAGVVTAMLTRIRAGRTLGASLYFKTWEEVGEEINQATTLFPSFEPPPDGVDIRREADRVKLRAALENLGAERLISQDARNLNAVLLASYLDGYEKVLPYMNSGKARYDFKKDRFPEHKPFVSDESMAVYLKDLAISMSGDHSLESQVELTDCQGSDSPNPLHLAMIEDYLYKTHLVIYVISSRTGVRRADIRFLNMLREMGLSDNVVFVVNADMSEHETVEDCQRVAGRVAEEVALIRPDPDVYCFSALYNLFGAMDELSKKDRVRRGQWQADTEFVEYSNRQTGEFIRRVNNRLTDDRLALLLSGHVERIHTMAAGVEDWVSIHSRLLEKDSTGARDMFTELRRQQDGIRQIRLMIRHTMDGALQKGRREIGREVDSFFDFQQGDVMRGIREFVLGYQVREPDLDDLKIPFSTKVYTAFQDLKTAVDAYMAETVNPRLMALVRGEERKISSILLEVSQPYDVMVRDALGRYVDAIREMGVELSDKGPGTLAPPDPARLKESAGLEIPPLTSTLKYGRNIRTEAVLRLGAYRAASGLKSLFTRKKDPDSNVEDARKALNDAVWRMKEETVQSLWAHFLDYRENLKFQYLYKMLERAARHMEESLSDRFQLYTEGMGETAGLLGEEQTTKDKARETLGEMRIEAATIRERVEAVRARIEKARPPDLAPEPESGAESASVQPSEPESELVVKQAARDPETVAENESREGAETPPDVSEDTEKRDDAGEEN